MSDRSGFTGGCGDRAVITIIDTGSGVRIEANLSHAPHEAENDESAVEAVADILFRSIGRDDWKRALVRNGS